MTAAASSTSHSHGQWDTAQFHLVTPDALPAETTTFYNTVGTHGSDRVVKLYDERDVQRKKDLVIDVCFATGTFVVVDGKLS